MFHRFSIVASFVVLGQAAVAQQSASPQALFEAMDMPELLEVMRSEGIVYGEQLAQELFPDRADDAWRTAVETIYDPNAMAQWVQETLATSLEAQGADIPAIIAFFESEPGRTFIDLEISARRALLDEAVEEASKEAAAIAVLDETPRFQMVRDFVEANDLVEINVVGAMNANYAFYTGLMDGGGFAQELTQEQVLTDVWTQEDAIRANTTEWVYSFLLMAYQPASDEDLQTYIAFSQSEPGRDLNTALFVAFDGMFENVSRALGLASSNLMAGQDL